MSRKIKAPRVILTWLPDVSVGDQESPGETPIDVGPVPYMQMVGASHAFSPALVDAMTRDHETFMRVIEVEAERLARDVLPHLQEQIGTALAAAVLAIASPTFRP